MAPGVSAGNAPAAAAGAETGGASRRSTTKPTDSARAIRLRPSISSAALWSCGSGRRALNQPPRLPEPHDQSAADEMLGRNLIALAESVGFVVERRDAPPVSAPAAAGAFPAATPGAMPGLGGGSAGVQPAAPAVGLNGSRGSGGGPGHADGGGPLRPIGGG